MIPEIRPTPEADVTTVDFGEFVRRAAARGSLVVQPRMGFDSPDRMRAGLAATKSANAATVGTLTLDSYTRLGEYEALADAMAGGRPLNGYPIVTHKARTTQRMLAGIRDNTFPVQVRHGSAVPLDIFDRLIALGLDATEGGPVSYCLPYGRTPLAHAVPNWVECVRRYAGLREHGREPHLESFGGCLLGQLCPPSLLVAVSVLEALFFHQHGVRSVSVSYAQQTDPRQDREAVAALRRLCAELLPTPSWHVVIYAYMGLYPVTDRGAYLLLGAAAELAVRSGAERLIVKTVAESRQIPSVEENVAALEYAAAVAYRSSASPEDTGDTETYEEAAALVHAVLDLDPDLGTALVLAFGRGYLDIPYCVHPDNQGRTRSYIDSEGRLRWAESGSLPLGRLARTGGGRRVTSASLHADLRHVQRTFDRAGNALVADLSTFPAVDPSPVRNDHSS